jgi:hypothetical protein
MFQAPGISMTIQGNGTVVVAATHLLHNRLLPDRADTFFGFFTFFYFNALGKKKLGVKNCF